jgi:hypothetical protein
MKRLLVVAIALGGCKKDKAAPAAEGAIPSPSAPASTAELDALWAKAPDGAIGGFVMSPRAIGMLEHGWHDLHAFLKTFDAFAPAEQGMAAELGKVGLSTDFAISDLGLAPGKGLAVFAVHDGKDGVMLLPVADRDKFLATVKGTKGASAGEPDKMDDMTCKSVDGWYACASDAALLDALGKGDLRGKLASVKARGDVEGVLVKGPFSGAAVLQLDRGAATVRATISGLPAAVTSKLGSPVKPRVDLDHAAGFAVLNLAPLVADVPAVPVVEGVTAADLAHAIDGPLTVTVAPGELAIDARVPLKDTAQAKKVIDHCGDIAGLSLLGAKSDGGTCHLPVPQYGFTIDVWLDGKELHVGSKTGAKPGAGAPLSTVGLELANGDWQMALWGHGTLLSSTPMQMPQLAELPPEAALALRAIVMMSEVGIGVKIEGDSLRVLATFRTGWANPDDVVAKLTSVPPEDILAGKGGDRGKAIADSSPKSPFAGDYQAGAGGLMIPTAAIGILAAVAIPAFLDYQRHAARPPPTP